MAAILNEDQIEFLANYLYFQPGFEEDGKKIVWPVGVTKAEIARNLRLCYDDKEKLYEYLEDFGHITDPMFDILLTVLIAN